MVVSGYFFPESNREIILTMERHWCRTDMLLSESTPL